MLINQPNVLAQADAPPASQVKQPEPVDLVERLVKLDPGAWQELFERYFKKMYSFAYVRTGDPDLAEDIASEVFAAAARGIKNYRQTGAPVGAWLYRIARNLTADQLEARKKRPQLSLDAVEIESPAFDTDLDSHNDLMRGMSALTREQQEVIVLRFMQDCSLAETAEAMKKNVGAVKLLQHRALAALRRQLKPARGGAPS